MFVNGSNDGRFITAELSLSIEVPESEFAVVSTDTTAAPLLFIPRDGAAKQTFAIVNEGNTPLSGTIRVEVQDSNGAVIFNCSVTVSPSSISNLPVGQSTEIVVEVQPDEDAKTVVSNWSSSLPQNRVL